MKKFFAICLLMVFVVSLQGCKKKMTYDDFPSIVYKEMLNVPEGSYIVVAYQDNCPFCEDLLKEVIKYYEYSQKHEEAMNIYVIDINDTLNQKMIFPRENEGKVEYKDPNGATSYRDIKIKAAPAVFTIESKQVVKAISDYSTDKIVDKAKEYFKDLMK